MKLIRCHVENFGALSRFDWEFQDGLNMVCQENGWGKSTFAAFLKVMFYGFGNEKKRSQLEREREKYKPWQGGIYGGSIEFEIGEKRYRMDRTFGEREREDTFMLFDLDTGLPTVLYSKEIGRELFRIDEESFMKTIYVSCADCSTGATDSIHAKLGNLAKNMYDVENYSEAEQKLQQELNRLTPNRKTGLLAKLEQQLWKLQEEIYRDEEEQQKLSCKKEEWRQKMEEREELARKQQALRKEMLETGKQQERQSLLALYQELCNQQREKEAQVEEFEDYFGNGIPEMEEVSRTINLVEQERIASATLEQTVFSESEQHMIDQIENGWEDVPNVKEVEHMLEKLEQAEEHQESESGQEIEEKTESKIEKKFPRVNPLLVIGLFLAIVGIILCVKQPLSGIFVFALGIACGLLGKKQRESVGTEVFMEQAPQETEGEELQKISEVSSVQAFLKKYPMDGAKDEKEHLLRIQVLLTQLDSIIRRKQLQEETERKIEVLEMEIAEFYKKYNLPEAESKMLQLQSMLATLEKYHGIAADFYKVARKKEEFEREHDIAAIFGDDSSQRGMEELSQQLEELSQREEQLQKELYVLQKEMEQLQEMEERMEEKRRSVSFVKQQIEDNKRRYQLVGLAKTYLQEAKEQFVAKYRSPISESFEKYVQILLGRREHFTVDVNLDVRKQEKGMYRSSQTLSDGWKDVISICLRFALVDAMYQREKPFLLLDDPFVNLDQQKIEGAFSLLKQVEKDYQIIYFSCHESRMESE